jgi:hypothetical protein
MYLHSLNHTVDRFNEILHNLLQDANDPISLPNLDLDTGKRSTFGDYPLADNTYAKFLERITSNPRRTISKDLKQHILEYYGDFADGHEPTLERLTLFQQMKVRDDR